MILINGDEMISVGFCNEFKGQVIKTTDSFLLPNVYF